MFEDLANDAVKTCMDTLVVASAIISKAEASPAAAFTKVFFAADFMNASFTR